MDHDPNLTESEEELLTEIAHLMNELDAKDQQIAELQKSSAGRNRFLKYSKKVLLFVASMLAASLVAITTFFVLRFLLVDCLGRIGFITSFLSWPVPYDWYAQTTVYIASAWLAMLVCHAFDGLAENRIQSITFAVLGGVWSLAEIVASTITNGFSFSVLVMYLIMAGTYLVAAFEMDS